MPKSKTEVMIEKLSRVFKDMEMTNPQICLYVTKSYGYRDIPGYFSVMSSSDPLDTFQLWS